MYLPVHPTFQTAAVPVACREGGEWDDGPRHPRQGASKEWNYKDYILL